jgi:sec-independent protein translocase protein TatA
MCGNLGVTELLIILVIVVLMFGGAKLPQVAESIGKSIKIFKRSMNANDEIEVTPKKSLDEGGNKSLAEAADKNVESKQS